MKPRKVALCMACYKGCEPPVLLGLVRMAFALGRRTQDQFKPLIAMRKRGELAANAALAQMEEAEERDGFRFTHVIWIDDDVIVDPDGICRLLGLVDDDHPVVAALAFERQRPYHPAIWRKTNTWGSEYHSMEQIIEYPEDDWVPIIASGLCCVAFDREVFDAIKKPYFDWVQPGYQRRDCTPDGYLFDQFDDAHIPCFCHTGVKVGHMTYPLSVDEKYARRHGGWFKKTAEETTDGKDE